MIDIHAHIIPALDDGPPDMPTSIGIGKLARHEGIRAIISTSHSAEAAAVGQAGMLERLQAVRRAWHAEGIDIALDLGLEIFLRPDTADLLTAGTLWTMAGSRYVLVELPYQPWPPYADEALFSLQLAGYVPILAHPERYSALQADPGKMHALVERGVLAQVTAAALLGEHGGATRRCAETLVKYNLAQFMSTDAHGTRWRTPHARAAIALAESMVGIDAVTALIETNPARVLANEEIVPEPRPPAARGGFFGGLFGRSG